MAQASGIGAEINKRNEPAKGPALLRGLTGRPHMYSGCNLNLCQPTASEASGLIDGSTGKQPPVHLSSHRVVQIRSSWILRGGANR